MIFKIKMYLRKFVKPTRQKHKYCFTTTTTKKVNRIDIKKNLVYYITRNHMQIKIFV